MNEARAFARVLVAGGAGFIGSHFVERVLAGAPRDGRVVVLDALTYAGRRENLAGVAGDPRFVFVHGDIADAPLVARLFREHAFDAVVNLAAESHVDRSIEDALPFVRTNVVGALTLLEGARRAWLGGGGDVRGFRFVHVSTDEVYGSLGEHDPEERRFVEGGPYDPSSPYAASKASSDHFARAYFKTYGLPVVVTHAANNYGPRQAPEKLIPRLIARALAGETLPVFGQGRERREWLFVGDHCDGLVRALERGRPGETYNLPGTDERPNLETAERLADALDAALGQAPGTTRRRIAFVTPRPGHDYCYAMDGQKARRELGYAPATPFDEGLLRTVRWYVENRDWLAAVETIR